MEAIMNVNRKFHKRTIALFLVIVMIITTFLPTITKGITLTDELYAAEYAWRSWDSSQNGYGSSPDAIRVKPTGLAFNWTTYSKTGGNWPFSAQAYLTQRPGYENAEYEIFNNRFIYCVANHVQNYRLGPGMQAFHSGTFTTEYPFPEAQKGANKEQQDFNFMMLAIATNYPGEIDYNPESKERIADALICQMIAWLATDENNSAVPRPGFCGDFATDLNYFKGSNVYYELLRSFTADQEPEIYNYLRQAPPAGSGASQHGITTMLDAIFYDIWVAADFACKLNINWTEEFASYNTQIIEENGEYHAYVDLWTSESAKEYFTGAKFVGYGDWTEVGVENGIAHYKSTTGETDEKGSIGHYEWPEELIGYYAPLDIAKAKLYTFTFYNDTVAEAGQYKFFNGQTYFASVIERGLELYVTIGEKEPEPGDGEVHVDRYEHEENFSAAYNVNLRKYDSETGKPLADSHWDILESFDDSQLDETNLDLLEVGEYTSNIGSLNNTSWEDGDDIETNYNGDTGLNESEANLYNWKNDDGTQFDKWTDPYDDPCLRDDNVTGDDGLLYEISSDGSASSFSNCKTYVCMIK